MKKICIFCALLCVLLQLTGCSKNKQATPARPTVSLGMLRSASSAPLFIALEKGYFEEAGLKVVPEWFVDEQALTNATASNKLNIGAAHITSELYNMVLAGQRLAIVADKGREEKGYPSSALLVTQEQYDQELTTLEKLKGKKVGLVQKGSPFHYMLGRILEEKGLSLNDVTLLTFDTPSAVMAALASKQIDACLLQEPNVAKVNSAGYGKTILQISDLMPYQASGIFFSPELRQNKDVAIRFLKAYSKACNYYYDNILAKNSSVKHQEIVGIIAKYTKMPTRELELCLPYIDRDGKLLVEDIKTQIDWYTAHHFLQGSLTPTQIVNIQLLGEALTE